MTFNIIAFLYVAYNSEWFCVDYRTLEMCTFYLFSQCLLSKSIKLAMQNFIVLKMRIVSILYAVTKSLLITYRPNVNLSFLVLLSSDMHDNNGGMIWLFTVLHYRKIKCLSHWGVKLLMSYSFISGIQDKKRQ